MQPPTDNSKVQNNSLSDRSQKQPWALFVYNTDSRASLKEGLERKETVSEKVKQFEPEKIGPLLHSGRKPCNGVFFLSLALIQILIHA